MPRFAANLAYLFTERPLIERFAAAMLAFAPAPAAHASQRDAVGHQRVLALVGDDRRLR